LPMHIPVLLAGIMLGMRYGFIVGAIVPLLRSVLFTFPTLPMPAAPMAFELATYGLVVGLLYAKLPKTFPFLFVSLVSAMLAGRVVFAVAFSIIGGLPPGATHLSFFATMFFITGWPGIAIQMVLVPIIIFALRKAGWRSASERA